MAHTQTTHSRFGLRLAATLVVATTVVGAAQYVLAGRALTHQVLTHDLDGHRADAEVLASLHRPGTADPLAEVGSLLGHMASRPGLTSAVLLDPAGEVVLRGMRHTTDMSLPETENAHGMAEMPADEMPMAEMPADEMPGMAIPADEPLPPADQQLGRAVLASGVAQAEHLPDDHRVLHAVPVQLGESRHVLLAARSDEPLKEQVGSVRKVLLATLGLGTALVLPLFFLLGGRGLTARHRRAVDASTKDGLTGLGNHRCFHERLAPAADSGSALCLALVDLDGFKQVNDTLGHRRGDEVLAAVADVLLDASPHGAYRVGGDEFALILPVSLAEATTTCEEVRRSVAALGLDVTTSIGLAPRTVDGAQPLWDAADAALYAAKRGGRDRVVVDGSSELLAGV